MLKRIPFFVLLAIFLSPTTIFAEMKFPFQGQIDFLRKEFSFRLDIDAEGSVAIRVVPVNDKDFHFSVNVDHLNVPLMTLSTIVEGDIKINAVPQGGRSVTGKVESKYTLINYKPIEEIDGVFSVKDNSLSIDALSLGRVKVRGTVGLQRPFPLDLAVDLSDVMMEDFLWFWTGGQFTPENTPSEGLVSGVIRVTGNTEQLNLKGELSSYNGRVSDLAYDSIIINAEGEYPVIDLYDSNVTETSGFTFTIDGSLNLEDRENFPKQIMALTKAPLVSEDPSKLEWTFKRIQKEKGNATTEIKYLLRKNKLEGNDDGGSDMLGVERRIGF